MLAPRERNNNWMRCVNCGHKLGKIVEQPKDNACVVEIKCHSCKTINLISIFKED